MLTQTFLTLALAALASSAPNMGPPKPKKTISLSALNDCGCDVPAFFIQECQNIPKSVSSTSTATKDCVCSRQWYGYSDLCADCLNNAYSKDEFPELVTFMGDLVSATKQIYTGCTLAGGSVSSDGVSVCGHTFVGDSCVSIAQDGKSGWVSYTGKNSRKGESSNVTAEFELADFTPMYEGQTLDIPDSGYPKEEEEEKSDEVEEEEKEDDSTSTSNENANSTSSETANTNGTASDTTEDVPTNADSSATTNARNLSLAAIFGLAIALFI